jgi:hypothetical protein
MKRGPFRPCDATQGYDLVSDCQGSGGRPDRPWEKLISADRCCLPPICQFCFRRLPYADHVARNKTTDHNLSDQVILATTN